MIIERATADRVADMLPLAKEFCCVLDWPFDPDVYVRYVRKLVSTGRGVLFIMRNSDVVVGGICGYIKNDPLSGDHLAVELAWYVAAEFRGTLGSMRLLALFERWAKERGCLGVCMIAMEKSNPAELDGIYRRVGYIKVETTYFKLCKRSQNGSSSCNNRSGCGGRGSDGCR